MKQDSTNIITDQAVTDTVAVNQFYTPNYAKGFGNDLYQDSVVENMANSNILTVPSGQQSDDYIKSPLHDTGTMMLFLLSIFLITISYRKGYKYISDFKKNLFSLKKRQNIFEEHNTFNEIQIQTALIANTCILEGILIECAVSLYYPSVVMSTNIFAYIICMVGLMAAFYLTQLFIFFILGYVFTNKTNTSLLIKGFNASQAILGLFLIPVVVLLLVYPHLADFFISAFIIIYILCRLLFIIKGVRIFFNNYYSFFLFILYLCSVEIVPIKLIYNGIIYLFSLF